MVKEKIIEPLLSDFNEVISTLVPSADLHAFTVACSGWSASPNPAFFWRSESLSTFAYLVIEILLVRTRAESVPPVARVMLERWPDAASLAVAKVESVEEVIRPLGLFRKRARALIAIAASFTEISHIDDPASIQFPSTFPYLGRYVANAVSCFHFVQRLPIVDANVARVLFRYFDLRSPRSKIANDELYWKIAESLLPDTVKIRSYNWALIDIGRNICRPRSPACEECPLLTGCSWFRAFATRSQ